MSDKFSQQSSIGNNIIVGDNAIVTIGDINISLKNELCIDKIISNMHILFINGQIDKAQNFFDILISSDLEKIFSHNDKRILDLLKLKISLIKKEKQDINYDLFLYLLRNQDVSPLVKNFVKSVEIHYIFLKSVDKAREIYLKSDYRDNFTQAVYFEFLASEDELNNFIDNKNINQLLEWEHFALIQCAVRQGNTTLAEKLAYTFEEKYANNNAEIILALIRTIKLIYETKLYHYWILDKNQWYDLQKLTDQCISLSENNQNFRIIQIAAYLFVLKRGQDNRLEKLYKKNTEKFKKYLTDIGLNLAENIPDDRLLDKSNFRRKNSLNEHEFNQLCDDIYYQKISVEEVSEMLNSEINLSISEGKDDIYKFYEILLKLILCKNTKYQGVDEDVFSYLDTLLESYSKIYDKLSLKLVDLFAYLLNRLSLFEYTQKFLEPFIPKEPWLSPIVFRYLEVLIFNNQFKTFENYFAQLEKNTTDVNYLYLKLINSRQFCTFSEIRQDIEILLKNDSKNINFWRIYLEILICMDLEYSEIQSIIRKIPESIYLNFNPYSHRLVNLIAELDIFYAKKIFLKWFIDNPSKLYKDLVNFYSLYVVLKESEFGSQPSLPYCSSAIIYKVNNKSYTKLLVDNCIKNEYLLDTKSNLAKKLIEANESEEFEYEYSTYKVVKKLNPFIAAAYISIDVCKHFNTEDDNIRIFTVDIDSILKRSKLEAKKQYKKNEYSFIFLNVELRKKAFNGINSILWDACNILTNKQIIENNICFDKGINSPNEIIIDFISVVYLALTGYCYGLIRTGIKIFITKETQSVLKRCIKNFDDGLNRFSDEKYVYLKKNLCFLLNSSNLIFPKIFDIPKKLIDILDYVDVFHYSSVIASVSNSIPLFCLDYNLSIKYENINIIFVNVNLLLTESYIKTQNSEKNHMKFFDEYFSMNNILELCKGNIEDKKSAVILIENYAYNSLSYDDKLDFLATCCFYSIKFESGNQLNQNEIVYTQDEIIYTCCNTAIKECENTIFEKTIAELIFILSFWLNKSELKSVITIFSKIISVHFFDRISIENCTNQLKKISKAFNMTLK